MPSKKLTIATRQSPLALWQANWVMQTLQRHHPALEVELLAMTTRGDRILDAPLSRVGGKGLFVKELEQAMLGGRADIAVHSMKDVPADFPEGLVLGAICAREDPSDAFVSSRYPSFAELPPGARLGTSSFRRQCQLRHLRPDLEISDLRGNVGTRLAKLDQGLYDAIILASAGLLRLGLQSRIRQRLPYEDCLPAVGQGAIGIEYRADDLQVRQIIEVLHDTDTADRVLAERALNSRLAGGCQVPIAAFAEIRRGQLFLRGRVGDLSGSVLLHAELEGSRDRAVALGSEVAGMLLARGADRILDQLRD